MRVEEVVDIGLKPKMPGHLPGNGTAIRGRIADEHPDRVRSTDLTTHPVDDMVQEDLLTKMCRQRVQVDDVDIDRDGNTGEVGGECERQKPVTGSGADSTQQFREIVVPAGTHQRVVDEQDDDVTLGQAEIDRWRHVGGPPRATTVRAVDGSASRPITHRNSQRTGGRLRRVGRQVCENGVGELAGLRITTGTPEHVYGDGRP